MKLKKANKLLTTAAGTAAIVRKPGKKKKFKIVTGLKNVVSFLQQCPHRVIKVN